MMGIENGYRTRMLRAFLALMVMSLASGVAVAQVGSADIERAWASYNKAFLTPDGSGGEFFAMKQGGRADSGFWEESEEIEVAEDHYDFARRNGLASGRDAMVAEINGLCTAFVNKHGHDWGKANRFNDDLDWASIAFARAYRITRDAGAPNAAWLADAKLNFDTVYTRGSTGNGGIAQIQPPKTGLGTWMVNMDAPANFAFVIAGYFIYENGGGVEYKDRADGVYRWSIANLYAVLDRNGSHCPPPNEKFVCGKVLDSNPGSRFTAPLWSGYPNTLRIGASDFTYNYGIAIAAATHVGGAENLAIAQSIANYLMFRMTRSGAPDRAYDGTITDHGTWNVLPDYGQGGKNNAGYNGIALRGVGYGIARGTLSRATLEWAQANVQAAWNNRNKDGLAWNKWKQDAHAKTPDDGVLFSWDCSAALAGMFDVPMQ